MCNTFLDVFSQDSHFSISQKKIGQQHWHCSRSQAKMSMPNLIGWEIILSETSKHIEIYQLKYT